jgi:hypothetical protein
MSDFNSTGVFSPEDFIPELPSVEEMIRAYLGPRLLTALLITLETGIIINQSIRFWSDARTERLAIQVLVVWVTVMAL